MLANVDVHQASVTNVLKVHGNEQLPFFLMEVRQKLLKTVVEVNLVRLPA